MELSNIIGELFKSLGNFLTLLGNFLTTLGKLFTTLGNSFTTLWNFFFSHNFGELFNIIGELLTNCVLARLKDLINFGEFRVILLHLDKLGSNNFGRFSHFWSILGDFVSFSSIRFQ